MWWRDLEAKTNAPIDLWVNAIYGGGHDAETSGNHYSSFHRRYSGIGEGYGLLWNAKS
jgi:hypothetical protein